MTSKQIIKLIKRGEGLLAPRSNSLERKQAIENDHGTVRIAVGLPGNEIALTGLIYHQAERGGIEQPSQEEIEVGAAYLYRCGVYIELDPEPFQVGEMAQYVIHAAKIQNERGICK